MENTGSITTTIEQAESVAYKLKLKDYKTIMSGGESVIVVSEPVAAKICRQYGAMSSAIGLEGKFALVNLKGY